jgi:hypothetical protein
MRIFKMLTLSDINAATNSKDGDIYSDLYKDVYGSRPRYATFESIEDFDADYERLVKRLSEQLVEEKIQQDRNFADFVCRVDGVMQMVQGATRERAVEIIADAEGIDAEEFSFYGLESLEYKFNLKYGSIAKWLSKEAPSDYT